MVPKPGRTRFYPHRFFSSLLDQDRGVYISAERFEEKASREGNVQASDRMRALALLYREMAEELEEDGLFEQRLFHLDFAEFACDGADAGVLPASVKIDSAGSFFRAGH